MDCITNCSPASHFFCATQPRCGGGAPASGIWSFRAVVLKNPKIRCTCHMQFVLGIPFVSVNKKRVTATGCPEARKCDAGPRVIGNNALGYHLHLEISSFLCWFHFLWQFSVSIFIFCIPYSCSNSGNNILVWIFCYWKDPPSGLLQNKNIIFWTILECILVLSPPLHAYECLAHITQDAHTYGLHGRFTSEGKW